MIIGIIQKAIHKSETSFLKWNLGYEKSKSSEKKSF